MNSFLPKSCNRRGGRLPNYQFHNKQFGVIPQHAENANRATRGEKPLPEEDLSKLFKPIPAISRLDATVIAGQINTYCKEMAKVGSLAFDFFRYKL